MPSKEYEMAIKIAGTIEKSFMNSTKLTKKELRGIAKAAAQTSKSIPSNFTQGMKETEQAFNGLEKAGQKAFNTIKKASIVTGAAVTAGTMASIKVGTSFEEQMSTVQAISGATANEMIKLNDKAKEMGANTKFSATEAGKAMEYMGMAGWKSGQMIGGIEGIMYLAAASGEELGMVADIVTDSLTAFNMKAEQSGHFADILAAAATNSNTNVAMMGETFKYCAPLAGALKYSAEDLALAIGLMANAGIKASNSGTAIRSWITRMAKPTKESEAAMRELKISMTDSKGEMKSFADIIYDTRKAFSKLTETEKAEYAAMIAGKTGMSGLLAVVNASEADLNKLYNSIENCNGAAQKMSEIRIDNLNGDVTILKSGLEGLGIQIYEEISAPMREGVQYATELVSTVSNELQNGGTFGDFLVGLEKKIPTAIRETKEFTDALIDMADPLLEVGKWLWEHPDVVVSTITGIGVALETYKVANSIMNLASGLALIGPAGAAVLGVAGVVTVISGIATYTALANREMKKQNLSKHFGKISLSMKELKDAANGIVRTKSLEKIEQSMKVLDDMGGISNSIQESIDAINKLNWKVSIGMELTDKEKQSYTDEVEAYIANVQELVSQKQYAVTLAVGELMDDGTEENNVVDKINAFYADKQGELQELGKKLNDTVTKAFQDGLLDMDEAKEITELQSQMAKIQSAVASSKFDSQLELLNLKYAGGKLDADTFQNLQKEINDQLQEAVGNYDESLTLSISNAKVMLDEGAINQTEYDNMVKELKKGYLEQIGDIELKATSFQMDTIKQQYAEEWKAISPELAKTVEDSMQEVMQRINNGFGSDKIAWGNLLSDVKNIDVDKDTKAALADLFKKMQPSMEQLAQLEKKYKEFGMKVPKSISSGLKDAAQLGAIAGDVNSIWQYTGNQIAGSQVYQETLATAGQRGKYIPEQIAKGIIENKNKIDYSVFEVHNYLRDQLTSKFSGGFDVTVPVRLKQQPASGKIIGPQLPGHANGGIFDKPHIAWFAEGGDKEAAIPINNSERSAFLWRKTGELLGLYNSTDPTNYNGLITSIGNTENTRNESTESMNITYSPKFVISSNVQKKDVVDAQRDAQLEFDRMMEKWQREHKRLSFR